MMWNEDKGNQLYALHQERVYSRGGETKFIRSKLVLCFQTVSLSLSMSFHHLLNSRQMALCVCVSEDPGSLLSFSLIHSLANYHKSNKPLVSVSTLLANIN